MATLSRASGGPLEAPLSDDDDGCVCMSNNVCGMVHVGFRVLSLSVEEGRSTFGVVAEI